ncbi:hypothetical protein [Novosphingobium sp. EMRT-2]|uniref:hypothetical protein n=1 Tax=Novosphingobium sp. EMRT-2 TaxID=2571749 RepID=UPI0010BD8200|nr:hypothetical protein [Novosphingobium sp. EMRT-2]QCI92189.1 hypothetical protein FA702_00465 [Novosphingobium sp. EMRT-2]
MRLRQACAILAAAPLSVAMSSAHAQHAEGALPLKSSEIEKALVGKWIRYNPPGWADSDIHEEFHPDGKWRGSLSGLGPIYFTGRWSIEDDRVCVVADKGTFAESWHAGLYCRQVLQNRETEDLLIGYLPDRPDSPRKMGLQVVEVRALPTPK